MAALAQAHLTELGIEAAPLFGHVGDGSFHLLPQFDSSNPTEVQKIKELEERMARLAISNRHPRAHSSSVMSRTSFRDSLGFHLPRRVWRSIWAARALVSTGSAPASASNASPSEPRNHFATCPKHALPFLGERHR